MIEPDDAPDTTADPGPPAGDHDAAIEQPAANDEEPEPFIARYAVPLALLASMLIGGIAFAVCNA